jgi:serine/threonine protein kinase
MGIWALSRSWLQFILPVCWQLLDAVRYMHSRGVCHLDIDPQNIVMETADAGGFLLKLIDFGSGFTSQQLGLLEVVQVKNKVPFRSPELERVMRGAPVLLQQQQQQRQQGQQPGQQHGQQPGHQHGQQQEPQSQVAAVIDGFACDMYACGVVIYWCALCVCNLRCLKEDSNPLWKEGVMRHADCSHSPAARHDQDCWLCWYESQAGCKELGLKFDTSAQLLPGPLLQLLRRLLSDDPAQRFAGGAGQPAVDPDLEQLKQEIEAALQ